MAVSERLMAWIVFVVSAAVIVYAGTKLSHYGDQIADLFNCRSLESPMFRIGVFSNRWIVAGLLAIVGLQLLLTYVPVINRLITPHRSTA